MSSIDNKHKHLGRRFASLSLLFALIFAYNFILFDGDDYSYQSSTNGSRRQLDTTSTTATVTVTEGSNEQQSSSSRHRKLLGSKNGPNPPPEDIADASYIVKPAIGASFQQVFETMDQTVLSPLAGGVTASSYEYWIGNDGLAANVLGTDSYHWRSKKPLSYPEWLEVDLGLTEEVAKLEVDFGKVAQSASGIDFELQCRRGTDTEYTTLETYTGYTAASLVIDGFISPSNYCRYMRLYFTSGYNKVSSEQRCDVNISFDICLLT